MPRMVRDQLIERKVPGRRETAAMYAHEARSVIPAGFRERNRFGILTFPLPEWQNGPATLGNSQTLWH